MRRHTLEPGRFAPPAAVVPRRAVPGFEPAVKRARRNAARRPRIKLLNRPIPVARLDR